MRARARALETEVTSLLKELPYDASETWMIPHSEMLCVLRYQEDPLGEARNNEQVAKYPDEEARQEEVLLSISSRTSGLRPGHPAPGSNSSSQRQSAKEATGAGHPAGGPDIRPVQPGYPAPFPEIRRPYTVPRPVLAGHPAPRPGHPAPACAQSTGHGPMYFPNSPQLVLALYKDLFLLHLELAK